MTTPTMIRGLALLMAGGVAFGAGAETRHPPFDRAVFLTSTNGASSADRAPATDSGSAFFIEDAGNLFLVTAKHVARATGPRTGVGMRQADGTARFAALSALAGTGDAPPWRMHETDDVALLPVAGPGGPDAETRAAIRALAVPSGLIVTGDVERGRPVAVCGFPLNLGAKDGISPLVMMSAVASRELPFVVDGKTSRMVLISPAVATGCSGGPVFLLSARNEVEGLAGLYVATYGDGTGGKLSSIVPAARIAALMAAWRADAAQAMRPPARARAVRGAPVDRVAGGG